MPITLPEPWLSFLRALDPIAGSRRHIHATLEGVELSKWSVTITPSVCEECLVANAMLGLRRNLSVILQLPRFNQ